MSAPIQTHARKSLWFFHILMSHEWFGGICPDEKSAKTRENYTDNNRTRIFAQWNGLYERSKAARSLHRAMKLLHEKSKLIFFCSAMERPISYADFSTWNFPNFHFKINWKKNKKITFRASFLNVCLASSIFCAVLESGEVSQISLAWIAEHLSKTSSYSSQNYKEKSQCNALRQ